MPLPILSAPKFETKLPSTGKVIQYRSYLVKEEKVLLMAMESKDSAQIVNAVKDIISACTYGKIDIENIPMFDLEYLFLKLRAKSVGEVAKLSFKCESCSKENVISINLDEVKVKFGSSGTDKKIKLTDNIGMTLKYPSMSSLGSINSDNPSVNDINRIIAATIDSIYDENRIYSKGEYSDSELFAFIDSLNRKQISEIENFISEMPHIEFDASYNCPHCKHRNGLVLSGLASFF